MDANPDIAGAIAKMAGDADPQVRMQVAYSLGAWDDPRAAEALAHLLSATPADVYLAAAAMSSLNKTNVGAVLLRALAANSGQPRAELIERLLSLAAALGSESAVRDALAVALETKDGVQLWQLAALGGFLDALDRRKANVGDVLGAHGRDALTVVLAKARQLAA